MPITPQKQISATTFIATNKRWTSGIVLLIALAAASVHGQTVSAPITEVVTNYHGWDNSVSLNNGVVEAVIVPTVGRVQQFRFVGDTNGALWENPRTLGRAPTGSGFYPNFGGDKAWPSPQSEWGWPPPRGFDGSVCTASFTNRVVMLVTAYTYANGSTDNVDSYTITNGIVTLVTPVDATYGIRTTRIIELLANAPEMRVRTVFERTAESSKTNLGVWIDCQATVASESRCYVPVPKSSIFPNGYTTTGSAQFTAALPLGFTNANGLISFGVNSDRVNHKVGFDGSTLLLVGPSLSLRLDTPRVPGATYPDGNSSTEVYTAGADHYFELEMLGPLAALPVGGKIEYVMTYSLSHRTEATTDAEAKKILSR